MICGEILQIYPAGSYLILLMSAEAICNVAVQVKHLCSVLKFTKLNFICSHDPNVSAVKCYILLLLSS